MHFQFHAFVLQCWYLFWLFACFLVLISLGPLTICSRLWSMQSLSRKLHVNLHMKFCSFRRVTDFTQDKNLSLYAHFGDLLHSQGWGGYHLYADNSKICLLLEPYSQLPRSTWTLPRYPRLKLSEVGTWSLPLCTLLFHLSPVLLSTTGVHARMP